MVGLSLLLAVLLRLSSGGCGGIGGGPDVGGTLCGIDDWIGGGSVGGGVGVGCGTG